MTLKVDQHGTTSRYTNRGCRCDECREAQRLAMREYRAKNSKVRQEGRQQLRDYAQAQRILRERHRAEFDAIYAEIRGTEAAS